MPRSPRAESRPSDSSPPRRPPPARRGRGPACLAPAPHLAALALLLSSGAAFAGFPDERPSLGTELTYQFTQPTRTEVGAGPTRVSAETGTVTPRAGYFPLRLSVDNRAGPAQAIAFSARGAGAGSAGAHRASRTVEVAAGERREVLLPVPVDLRYGVLEVRGATVSGTAPVSFDALGDNQHLFLCLGAPEEFEAFVGHPPAYTPGEAQVSTLPPGAAPTELAAYVGYDGVVVPTAEGWTALSDAQRRALEAYAAAGGTLSVRGPLRATADFPLLRGAPKETQPYGFGTLSLRGHGPARPATLAASSALVSPEGPPHDWDRRSGRTASDYLLPEATAPLGRFLIIIALFTLAIGPGSVWISRRRGPSALLVTIPATALFTCALLIGYSLVADGFTVHGSVQGYTLIDRASNRAITQGVTAYYANLAPSRASFATSVAVVAPWSSRRAAAGADVEWKDGQRFGGDFVPSRSYREWGLVAVEPTRARVGLKRRGDGWAVQNALGFTARALWVNVDGAIWHAGEVRDGEEAVLQRGTTDISAGRGDQRFSKATRERVVRSPQRPGQFLAFLEGQGFVPTGGLSLSLHESQQFVAGEVDP